MTGVVERDGCALRLQGESVAWYGAQQPQADGELEADLLHTFLSVSSFCIGAAVVTRSEPLGISSTVALNWATYKKETAKTVRRLLQSAAKACGVPPGSLCTWCTKAHPPNRPREVACCYVTGCVAVTKAQHEGDCPLLAHA